jgi:alpha-glucosidase
MPVVRNLCITDPFDGKVYEKPYQYQFLCGDALLVIPVTSREKSRQVYLPGGEWYDLYTDELTDGRNAFSVLCPLHRIPLYVRASSVIPMQSLVQATSERPSDTLFLHIYQGREKGSSIFYEDDGATMDYKKGGFCRRSLELDPVSKILKLTAQEGSYISRFRAVRCFFHGFGDLAVVSVNGNPVQTGRQKTRLLDGLRYLEDIYDPTWFRSLRASEHVPETVTISFPYSGGEILVQWK